MKLPWFRKKETPPTPPSADLSMPLYQALVQIRDEPKPRWAKNLAARALDAHRPARHLFRALLKARDNAYDSQEIIREAILDATIANRLARSLNEIRRNPRDAVQIATDALLKAARDGARCSES